jgi:hypothetical protein
VASAIPKGETMTKADIHPEHVHPDYEAMTERLEELGITRLSDDLGISFDERTDNAILWDHLQAHSPWKVHVINGDEMWELVFWWVDKHCLCGEEIPKDQICQCLDQAFAAYGFRFERGA